MIHTDTDSRRSRIAIRFFTYGVMTISTIVISTICVLFALGYRFDNESRTVEQGGLLQFVSTPANATVEINGKRQSARTPSKANIFPGRHDITMKLAGYRDWNKTVEVEAGQIHWLNYARFVPQEITTTSVKEFDTLHASQVSPNKRYIVLQPAANEPRLIIANIRNEDNVLFDEFSIPESAYTRIEGEVSNFELIEWNLDGRYLLVRHTTGEAEEFIRFDRQNPEQAINLSSKFGPITKAQFAGNNGNVIFALVEGQLRRVTVSGDSEAEVLADGVSFFVVYRGDTIGFIADKDERREVGIIKNGRETIVQDYPAQTPLTIALSNYFNNDYMAIATENKVDIIREPADAQTAVAKMTASFVIEQPTVQWLYFSNHGRFLVAQHQGAFTTYDLELNKKHQREFSTSQEVMRPFRWIDDYYLWIDLDNSLRIVEFDGANERVITSVERGYSVTLSGNGEILFSIGRNSETKSYLLQQSPMVIAR